jgi:phage baseplate assembly protein W
MADSAGFDRRSGRLLTDWAHVQQSIEVILTTPIGSRVMRRDFGSELPDLVDRKMTPRLVLALYAAAAVAIRRWEPRFRLTRAGVTEAGATGRLGLVLYGTYFPRGHRGDFSVAEDASTRIIFQGAR